MRPFYPLCVSLALLVVVVLLGQLMHGPETDNPARAGASNPPARLDGKGELAGAAGPDGAVGPDRAWVVKVPHERPKLMVRFWFAESGPEFREAAKVIADFEERAKGTVAVFGFVGVADEGVANTARAQKLWRSYNVVLINEKDSCEIKGKNRVRRVRFVGTPGKEYSLSELKLAMEQAYGKGALPREVGVWMKKWDY